jgi:hypothetical protein
MSNSRRVEAATRSHVGAVLTNDMIKELVKLSDPNWTGGIYPSDAAYVRTDQGLVPAAKSHTATESWSTWDRTASKFWQMPKS